MKNTWKRLLAMTLVASMLTGMLGVGTLAAEETGEEKQSVSTEGAYEIREDTQITPVPEESEEAVQGKDTQAWGSMTFAMPLAGGERWCFACRANTLIYVPQKDPTCQEKGVKAHYTCPSCGRNFHRNTAGLPNVYTGEVDRIDKVSCDYSVPATCMSKATCKWCGAEDPNGAVDPDNHAEGCTLGDWIVTDDSHYKVYSECGARAQESAHVAVGVPAVPATCLAAGTTSGTKCATCGKLLSGVAVDPQKEHSYTGEYVGMGPEGHAQKCVNGCGQPGGVTAHSGSWVETRVATCTQKGEETQTCICGHVSTRETDRLDHEDEDGDNKCDHCGATICEHDMQTESTTPATCTSGTVTVEKCSKCGYTKTTEADDRLGHDFQDVQGSDTATCTQPGQKVQKCSRCVETQEVATPAKGHNYGELVAEKAATCTEKGMKAHYTCSACGQLFDENKVETTEEKLTIKASGHKWTEGEVDETTYERTDICEKCDATRTVSFVARVQETGEYYETLQAAINAATDGQTVEVLKSTVGAALQDTKKVTVNIPEGVTVGTNTGRTYALAVAGADAELTITGAGTVQGSAYGVVAQSYGKLNVNMVNGTIKATDTKGRGIYVLTSGNANVFDGTIIGYIGIYVANKDAKVTVSGGKVEGTQHGMYLSRGASATVEQNADISVTETAAGFGIFLWGPGGELDENGNLPNGAVPTTLTVVGGKIHTTKNAAISGNGSVETGNDARYTKITITGGEITSTESFGIYHPQVGELTITGGTVTGISGIEMRAGTLNVSGNAAIIGNGEYEADENNNGATTKGVGIALSQHTTERPIMAVISGGTVTGCHAVVEHDLENDPQSENVALKIEDGIFTATGGDNVTIISDNLTKFITGGYFSDDLDAVNDETVAEAAEYMDAGYVSHPVGGAHSGYYHVHQPAAQEGWSHDDAGHWGTCKGHEDCLVIAVEKADHIWNDGVVTVEPTYDTEGLRTFTCTVCGHTRTESIPVRERPSTGGDDDDGPTTPTPRPTETPEPTPSPDPIPNEDLEELDEPDVPLAEVPVTELPETEQLSTEPPKEEFEELEDEDVPLAEVPETGDSLGAWLMMSAGALLGLAWLGKKREEA